MNKKIRKEANGQGKKIKMFRKNHVDKNKEKKGILCAPVTFCIFLVMF